jgi:hypothetical protein
MIFRKALLSSLALATYASASLSNTLLQTGRDLEIQLQKDADFKITTLTRRQDQPSTTPQSVDPSMIDLATWNPQTQKACETQLSQLNGNASNPSGLAVCYNLPFFNSTKGVFQAELRMYNISAPRDDWVGVLAADVQMSLSYLGASIQSMNASETVNRRDVITWSRAVGGRLVERQNTNNGVPEELKTIMFVGRVNDRVEEAVMTEDELRTLLIPKITLAATSPLTGQRVNTTLSSDEASFVNGFFVRQSTSTNNAAAQASASAAVAEAAPFELPGTKLAFFPTGLVITGVWTLGLVGSVGLGTFGRIQFRDQYRRRMKRDMATGVRTF